MPLTVVEQAALFDAAIAEYGEDYQQTARIVRLLRRGWPATDWIAVLRERAYRSAAFAASGLSVEWWVDTVDQMSR